METIGNKHTYFKPVIKILNYGSLNIDLVYRVPHIVRPGETISSGSFLKYAGGKGANQSAAIARAGGLVYHAGKAGGKNADESLRQACAASAICVTRPGAMDSIPSINEVRSFLK